MTPSELKTQKAQITAEREKFTGRLQDINQSVSGISKLAFLFGENELAQQIATFGQSSISVIENIGGLMGVGMLAGSINPLCAIGSIAMGINNIVNLFKPKSSPVNVHAMILKSLAKLSEQVSRLKEEMRNQFIAVADQLEKQHKLVLDKFSEISSTQLDIMESLRSIYFEIHYGFKEQQAMMTMLSSHLSSIEKRLDLTAYREDVDNLLKCLLLVYDYKNQEYNKVSADIDSIGLMSSRKHQLENPMKLPDALSPTSFFHNAKYFGKLIIDNQKLLAGNGQILYVPKDIPNPLLVIYSCFAALKLNLNVYPQPDAENPDKRIKMSDINRLKRYLAAFEDLERLFVAARSPQLIAFLVSNYQTAIVNLKNQLQIEMQRIQDIDLKKVKLSLDDTLGRERVEAAEQFTNQKIEIGTYSWFSGNKHWEHRYYAGKDWFWPRRDEAYIDTESRDAYIRTMEKQIADHRSNWRKVTSDRAALSKNNFFNVVDTQQVFSYHGIRFLKPIDSSLPYLPAPNPLLPSKAGFAIYIKKLFAAEALGAGYVDLSYDVSKQKKMFSLYIDFVHSNKRMRVITFNYNDYNPLFYTGGEAVWNYWLGGNIATKPEGVSKSKVTGNKLVPLPNGGHQAFLGMGEGHKNGEFEYTEYTYKVPEDFTNHVGKLKSFENNPYDVTVVVNFDEINSIEKIYKEQLEKFLDETSDELSAILDYHKTDKLGVACHRFEEAYRDLYGLLSFGYYDILQDSNSLLAKWFSNHPVNLRLLKQAIRQDKSPSNILGSLTKLDAALSTLPHEITESVRLHNTEETPFAIDFNLFTLAKLLLEEFMLIYEKYADDFPQEDRNSVIERLAAAVAVPIIEILPIITTAEGTRRLNNLLKPLLTNDEMANKAMFRRISRHLKSSGYLLLSPMNGQSVSITYDPKKAQPNLASVYISTPPKATATLEDDCLLSSLKNEEGEKVVETTTSTTEKPADTSLHHSTPPDPLEKSHSNSAAKSGPGLWKVTHAMTKMGATVYSFASMAYESLPSLLSSSKMSNTLSSRTQESFTDKISSSVDVSTRSSETASDQDERKPHSAHLSTELPSLAENAQLAFAFTPWIRRVLPWCKPIKLSEKDLASLLEQREQLQEYRDKFPINSFNRAKKLGVLVEEFTELEKLIQATDLLISKAIKHEQISSADKSNIANNMKNIDAKFLKLSNPALAHEIRKADRYESIKRERLERRANKHGMKSSSSHLGIFSQGKEHSQSFVQDKKQNLLSLSDPGRYDGKKENTVAKHATAKITV